MRIAVGVDHAGFPMKALISRVIEQTGSTMLDLGTSSTAPVDYPDFAHAVAQTVRSGGADRGILVCGSGVGASIAANKVPGIRAGLCHDVYSARQGVEHDDMNVLCLGSRVIGPALAEELVRVFLAAEFSGEERHVRRLTKILAIEREACAPPAAHGHDKTDTKE